MERLYILLIEITCTVSFFIYTPIWTILLFETIPCAIFAITSAVISFFCKTIKARLFKTILIIVLWIPFRLWWIQSIFYAGILPHWDAESVYFFCNITLPELCLLMYYVTVTYRTSSIKKFK